MKIHRKKVLAATISKSIIKEYIYTRARAQHTYVNIEAKELLATQCIFLCVTDNDHLSILITQFNIVV